MTTAYNLRQQMNRGAEAGRQYLLDAGSGGTVKVAPTTNGVLQIDSSGTRTLQAATQLAVGTEVLALATASGVTVNTTSIADGAFARFVVTLNSSGVNQWSQDTGGAIADLLTDLSDLATEVDTLNTALGIELAYAIETRTSTELGASRVITPAEILTNKMVYTSTSGTTMTLPAAADLVAAWPSPLAQDSCRFFIQNASAGAMTIAIGGAGFLGGNAPTDIATGMIREYMIILINVGTPLYHCYCVSSNTIT